MSNSFFLGKILNTGSQDITVTFTLDSSDTLSFLLPPGGQSELINLEMSSFVKATPLFVSVSLANESQPARMVCIYYEVNAQAKNEFFSGVMNPSGSAYFRSANTPVSPDTNMWMSFDYYAADGVVVVGTGDL